MHIVFFQKAERVKLPNLQFHKKSHAVLVFVWMSLACMFIAGAYYYHHTEKGKNYEQTMLDVLSYAEQEKIPYRLERVLLGPA